MKKVYVFSTSLIASVDLTFIYFIQTCLYFKDTPSFSRNTQTIVKNM